jgi:hypothetical protein
MEVFDPILEESCQENTKVLESESKTHGHGS